MFDSLEIEKENTQAKGRFGFCFLKLYLRTLFGNIENNIFVYFGNFSYSFDLMFSIFFLTVKKTRTKHILHVFLIILVF